MNHLLEHQHFIRQLFIILEHHYSLLEYPAPAQANPKQNPRSKYANGVEHYCGSTAKISVKYDFTFASSLFNKI